MGLDRILKESILHDISGKAVSNTLGNLAVKKLNQTIRGLIFVRAGDIGHFDPVWKLNRTQMGVLDDDQRNQFGDFKSDPEKNTADDFAGEDVPKYKFIFTVSFIYRSDIATFDFSYPTINPDTNRRFTGNLANGDTLSTSKITNLKIQPDTLGGSEGNTFAVKVASRPNPTINYIDVNMYNYRTKIATKVDYGTSSITFYDDSANRAHDIVEAYLKVVSPIANIGNAEANASNLKTWAQEGRGGQFNSASIGPLLDEEEMGPLTAIQITHYLPLKVNKTTKEYIQQKIKYTYFNPKIINAALDELDMTQNDVSTITLNFNYDSVHIGKVQETIANSASGAAVPTKKPIDYLDLAKSSLNTTLKQVDNAINNSIKNIVKR